MRRCLNNDNSSNFTIEVILIGQGFAWQGVHAKSCLLVKQNELKTNATMTSRDEFLLKKI